MNRLFGKLLTIGGWKGLFASILMLASSATIAMPHPWFQQQSVPNSPQRDRFTDHKCVPVRQGLEFTFEQCLYVRVRPTSLEMSEPSTGQRFCTGGCFKGTFQESFSTCVPEEGSVCVAEYKMVKVKITHEGTCERRQGTNECQCVRWRKLTRPREEAMELPVCGG